MTRSIACIVGARPNLVKMAPILAGMRSVGLPTTLVHTGQHYDAAMNDVFFAELGLPEPDVHLDVGSGRQGEQTAKIITRYENWLLEAPARPVATLVVGDVNSTMACALASVKLGIPVIHVEAGLRSFDRSMPEEINRIVTDSISSLLLVSEPSGTENLVHEGHDPAKVREVGNVMIDVLVSQLPAARASDVPGRFGLEPGRFVLWTMHRPSNVDDPATLARLVESLLRAAERASVVFPVHPRTRARLDALPIGQALAAHPAVRLCPPLGYLDFLGLSASARLVVTDSGGLQEESAALGIPCLTLRANTERPITVTQGTSTLVGNDADLLDRLFDDVWTGRYKQPPPLAYWDGHAGERVAAEVARFVEAL